MRGNYIQFYSKSALNSDIVSFVYSFLNLYSRKMLKADFRQDAVRQCRPVRLIRETAEVNEIALAISKRSAANFRTALMPVSESCNDGRGNLIKVLNISITRS